MNVIRWLKSMFARSPTRVRRWSDGELAAKKKYLEGKPPESLTVQDWGLAVEYQMHRYVPASKMPTEARWQEIKAQKRVQIEANLAKARAGIVEPQDWELENARQEQLHTTLQTSYRMSESDFRRVVLPLLGRFPFGGPRDDLQAGVARNLWLASGVDFSTTDYAARYDARDAKDLLIGYHPCVLETGTQLRKNYETLRKARNAGCMEVRVIVGRSNCRCFGGLLDEAVVPIAEALVAFDGADGGLPVFPPIETPCGYGEDPRICNIRLLPIEPPAPTDDPEFAEWLRIRLNDGPAKRIPVDWKQILVQRGPLNGVGGTQTPTP